MKPGPLSRLWLAGLGVGLALTAARPARADDAANRRLVEHAMHELFVNRDLSAIDRYWGGHPYRQHNPHIADGTASLRQLVATLPGNFRYQPGLIVADHDIVMLHGSYTGFGPQPLVVVDIFRIAHGRIVEHWDVMQPEIPAARTASHRPMFAPGQ